MCHNHERGVFVSRRMKQAHRYFALDQIEHEMFSRHAGRQRRRTRLASKVAENGEEKQDEKGSAEPAGHLAIMNNLVHMFTKNL